MYKSKTIDQISKKFVEEMQKGNVNGALKLLTNNIQDGIVPLSEGTILKLQVKHAQTVNPELEILFPDGVSNVHPFR